MTFAARLAALTLLLSPLALAQAPAAAKPANATGQCKDGSFSTAASKAGACRGHNGVKDWYVAAPPAASTKPATTVATPAPTPVPTAKASAPATAVKPVPAPAPLPAAAAQPATKSTPAKGPRANLANTPVAPGGGPGLVWVNTSSNVYHCPGTDFYGKTKAGSYMSEAAAKTKGARPDHGNACTK